MRGSGTFARRCEPSSEGGALSIAIRIRESLSRRLGIGLENSPETAGLLRAILLGDKSALSKTSRETFSAAGTAHVFAISGLHVVIVAKLLSLLLTLMFVPRRWTGLALIPLTVMIILFTLVPSLTSSTSFMIIPAGALAIGLAWMKYRREMKGAADK